MVPLALPMVPMVSMVEVRSMQRSGIEAIRTQIQPSKPKRETTKTTNSRNTKRRYGQPSEQLFPERWPLSNPNRTKNNTNSHTVKRHRKPSTKTGNKEPQQNHRIETIRNEPLSGSNQIYGPKLTPCFEYMQTAKARAKVWLISTLLFAA